MSASNSSELSNTPDRADLRHLWRVALISTVFTLFVIFAGGLVRVAGAGLGCPDWPKCFGGWFPPTDVSQLPPGIDRESFNVTLAWIEYLNRLSGALFGLFLIYQSIVVLRRFRHDSQILWSTLLATFLTGVQGWLGARVVASELAPVIVTLHMALALVILSLLIWTLHRSRRLLFAEDMPPREKTSLVRRLTILLWVVAIIQISLGAAIRESLQELADAYPLVMGRDAHALVGQVKTWHLFGGIILAVLTGYVWRRALQIDKRKSSTIRIAASSAMHTTIMQIVIGLVLMLVSASAVVQLFHLILASVYIAAVVFLYGSLQPGKSQ